MQAYIRLLIIVVTLTIVPAGYGHHARQPPAPSQQAKANAALLGLWTNTAGKIDFARARKVTSSQINKVLDRGADVNVKARYTPLMLAAATGVFDCVKLLVSKGAAVNARTTDGATALLYAAQGGNVECVKFLMRKGADITAKNRHGVTPLMGAAFMGSLASVQYLVLHGSEVNAKDDRGMTALLRAASSGGAAKVKYLVSIGANLHVRDKNGETALTLAHGYPDVIAILKAAGTKDATQK